MSGLVNQIVEAHRPMDRLVYRGIGVMEKSDRGVEPGVTTL
jgi:hypothetical protein